jgi:hypothetical protein
LEIDGLLMHSNDVGDDARHERERFVRFGEGESPFGTGGGDGIEGCGLRSPHGVTAFPFAPPEPPKRRGTDRWSCRFVAQKSGATGRDRPSAGIAVKGFVGGDTARRADINRFPVEGDYATAPGESNADRYFVQQTLRRSDKPGQMSRFSVIEPSHDRENTPTDTDLHSTPHVLAAHPRGKLPPDASSPRIDIIRTCGFGKVQTPAPSLASPT